MNAQQWKRALDEADVAASSMGEWRSAHAAAALLRAALLDTPCYEHVGGLHNCRIAGSAGADPLLPCRACLLDDLAAAYLREEPVP